MIFYKNMLISTILSVVLLLGIFGYMMYSSKNKEIFPATISDCPDYYDIDSSGAYCVANRNVWAIPSASNSICSSINFKTGSYTPADGTTAIKYTTPGKNASSGICAKKNMAKSCGITWEGITNNTSIC